MSCYCIESIILNLNNDVISYVKISSSEQGLNNQHFYIQDTEVTNAQFRNFVMETKNRNFNNNLNLYNHELNNHPVTNVTPSDCDNYCRWLTSKMKPSSFMVRVPTKNEWIIAAYGDGRKYPWGNDLISYSYNYNSEIKSRALIPLRYNKIGLTTNSVKLYTKGATPEKVYGMWGNVSEFVAELNDNNKGWNTISYWMGGGYSNKPNNPSQKYWGYSDNPNYKSESIGFRTVLVSSLVNDAVQK
jgi:formylglycine-generating enzyme required for sulfatase activity